MKKTIIAFALVALTAPFAYSQGRTNVRGTVRKDGTYVAPHQRTRANSTKRDSWSTRGNTNPNTGRRGTKKP
jgi:hypothetical protein